MNSVRTRSSDEHFFVTYERRMLLRYALAVVLFGWGPLLSAGELLSGEAKWEIKPQPCAPSGSLHIRENTVVWGEAETVVGPRAGHVFARIGVQLAGKDKGVLEDVLLEDGKAGKHPLKYLFAHNAFRHPGVRSFLGPEEVSALLFEIPRECRGPYALVMGQTRTTNLRGLDADMPPAPDPCDRFPIFADLGLRPFPHPGAKSEATIPAGTRAELLYEYTDWAYVKTGEKEGWVHGLALVPSEAEAKRIAGFEPAPNALFLLSEFKGENEFSCSIVHGELNLGKEGDKPKLKPGNCVAFRDKMPPRRYSIFGKEIESPKAGKLYFLDNDGRLAPLPADRSWVTRALAWGAAVLAIVVVLAVWLRRKF